VPGFKLVCEYACCQILSRTILDTRLHPISARQADCTCRDLPRPAATGAGTAGELTQIPFQSVKISDLKKWLMRG
jgi:hypothetical protein